MRKRIFSVTLRGDQVRRSGPVRPAPTLMRVRVYDDGEVVITTRGRWHRGAIEHYSPEAVMEHLLAMSRTEP